MSANLGSMPMPLSLTATWISWLTLQASILIVVAASAYWERTATVEEVIEATEQ